MPDPSAQKNFQISENLRACRRACGTPQRSGVNKCSEQDGRASGFRLVAREPKLMYGAKGARILTEINRLPQSLRQNENKNCSEINQAHVRVRPFRDQAGRHLASPAFLLCRLDAPGGPIGARIDRFGRWREWSVRTAQETRPGQEGEASSSTVLRFLFP